MIERGIRQPPRHVAIALAQELGIDLADVLELAREAQAEYRREIARAEIARMLAA